MRKPDASIVQISASPSFVATPYQLHVSAAKAGIDMLTRGLALEWGADGIRINSIIPGPIDGTKWLKRLEDVSRVALMLASDWGSYITGTVIAVDGGLALTGPRDFSADAAASALARLNTP